MREHLYKAKRADGNGWVEGCYNCYSPINDAEILVWDKQTLDIDRVSVDPETVCQYTGMKDKNGAKIFEGDKVLINRIGDYPLIREQHVIYNCDFATFATNKDRTFDWMRYERKIEVTGNIHD